MSISHLRGGSTIGGKVIVSKDYVDNNFLPSIDVTATPQANKVLRLNATSKLPASITGNADGNAGTATKLATARTIALAGDVTGSIAFDGSGNVSIATAYKASGVTAGTYTKVTVDARGIITSATTLIATDIPVLDWSKITTGKPTLLSGYGITDAVNISEVVTVATANKILKLDATGKLPASVTGNANTATTLETARTISLTGDVSGSVSFDGSGNASIATTYKNSGVTAGTYTKVTVDAKGSITAATNLVAADIPVLDWSKITTGKPTTLAGYGITNALALSGGTLTGFLTLHANPTSDLHVASKQYVDGLIQGIRKRTFVKAATTTNITLSGTQTIDGVVLVVGDSVLVKDQTDKKLNGVWDVQTGAWTRDSEYDANSELDGGSFVFVDQGSINDDTGWVVSTNNPLVIGTSDIVWIQFSGVGTIIADTTTIVKTGNMLSQKSGVITPGTYIKTTVDTYGRVTSGTSLIASDIPNLDWSKLTTGKPTTLAGYGITDAALVATVAATLPATIGWYRIATSAINIDRAAARFELDWNLTGNSGQLIFNAGIMSGVDPTINQTFLSRYAVKGITKARIVYNASPVGNYAYLEVYNSTAEAIVITTQMFSSLGWSLITPIAGSIPANYTNLEATFYDGIMTDHQMVAAAPQGTAPFVVVSTTPVDNLNINGNAATATKLATARTISLTGDVTGSVSFDGTGNAAIATVYKASGVGAGTYRSVTVDSKGIVTAGTNPTTIAGYGLTDAVNTSEIVTVATANKVLKLDGASKLPASITGNADGNAATATKLATARSFTLAGDITGTVSFDGTANVSITTVAKNSGVTAGTYTKVTVDAKGIVTSATNLVATDIPNLDWSKLTTGKPTTLAGYGITDGAKNVVDFGVSRIFKDLAAHRTIGDVTGTLKITLPTSWDTNMMTIVLKGYDYSGYGSYEVVIGGYTYETTPQWVNTSVAILGNAPFNNVRLGHDGTKCCILLGLTNTIWSYPEIFIDEMRVTNSTNNYSTGWTLGFITSETGITHLNYPIINYGMIVENARKLSSARTIALTGDVTGSVAFDGSGNVSIATAYKASGVTAGTYTKVTVDAKGNITSGTTLVAADIPNLDWSKLTTGKPTTLAGYGITDASPSSHLAVIATTTVLGHVKSGDGVVVSGTGAMSVDVDGTSLILVGTSPNKKVAHADTSTQASITNSGGTVIQSVTVDGFGHITAMTSKALAATDVGALPLSGGTMTGRVIVNDSLGVRVGNADLVMTALTPNTMKVQGVADPTGGGFAFGSAGDTNLYRQTANTLKTDDSFKAQDVTVAEKVRFEYNAIENSLDIVFI